MSDLMKRLERALSDRYRMSRLLGRGGMATVFLAEDIKHGRQVAIKVLDSDIAATVGAARFLREIELAARLAHPHILPLFDSGNAGELLFYVMPYVSGESLRHRLNQDKMLPMEEAMRITREVAGALDYAHRQRVIHRDIKPENILLQEGHALVSDFGIARAMAQSATDAGNATATALTGAGAAIGTPAYMSPEQVAGNPQIDGRSDIYSLGCVVYEMITGQPPFTGPAVESILYQHMSLEPRPVSTLRTNVSLSVERALARALLKTPSDRFQTVTEFISAFDARNAGEVRETPLAGPAGAPVRSLAVLPLENLSGDPKQEYFADGMTESLIAMLGKIEALRVISRTSIMTYKGVRKPIPVIARELNVDAIMEGTVLTVGDQVRISAQLILARDDTQLWSETVDRDMRDVLSLQAEVARSIAAAIRIKLTQNEKTQLETGRQVDPAVYRRDLMGKYAIAQRTIDGFREAITHYREAIAMDPTYAPAHAGLSMALVLLSNYGVEPPAATHQAARTAAERAIELDPKLYDGHVPLAIIRWQYEWDWDGAEEQILRAIELNPGAANARHWHGAFLAVACRFEEAVVECRRAQSLDPLSYIFIAFEGWIRTFEGRDDLAIDRLRYALTMSPQYIPALFFLGLSLTRDGRAEEGVEVLGKCVGVSGRLARAVAYYCFACARAGQTEKAAAALAELEERARRAYMPPYFLAIAHGALGNMDQAMEWLERGFAERDVMMRDLHVDVACEPLRRDPRCRDVIHRMGLPR